ncbi:hypothetical protein ACQP1W_39210 [Spirillospora sp. CA-255316]
MIAALVLASAAALLALSLPRLLQRSRGTRRARPARADGACSETATVPPTVPPPAHADTGPGPYPESLTAELDPWEEEYLAFLADDLWPEDEYLDMEHTIDFDGEGETGPGKYH